MIFVGKQKEPATFNTNVRVPGNNALAQHSGPITNKSFWRNNNFWRHCLLDLYSCYGGICAYLGLRLHGSVGRKSIEHFVPKSVCPYLAYEWDNFRLVSHIANENRGNTSGILDPFLITDDMFELLLHTGIVKPKYSNRSLSSDELQKVQSTIDILNMNDDHFCNTRKSIYERYITKPRSGRPDPDALLDEAPFVWLEAVHQGKIII